MPIWHFLPILFDTFYRFYFTFSTLMADGIQAMIRGTHGQAEVCATAYSPRRQLADKEKKPDGGFSATHPHGGTPVKSSRPATRLLLKNVCLTHMDGTENHSLNDLFPHASVALNNTITHADTNQVLRDSSRGGQYHGGSKAKGLL